MKILLLLVLMHKKNLFLRSLYDFGNSFIMINFLLYFSQRLVIDGWLSDFWYNALFAISSVLLLLSAPLLASFADKYGGNKYLLALATLGTWLSYAWSVLLAYSGGSMIFIALLFLLWQYFYQLSFVFFNTLLDDIADQAHKSRASGIGQFANSIGQLCGLLFAMPFAATRLWPLLPSVLVFAILSLPMLFLFQEKKPKIHRLNATVLLAEWRNFFKKMIIFFSTSVAVPMLVAFFFFNDALITVTNNYALYLERVFSLPDMTKNIIMMIILILSAVGGLVFWPIADKIGSWKSLKYILISWIVLLPFSWLVTTIPLLIFCSALLGFFMWGIRTVTRAYLSQMLNKEDLWYGFSYYTIVERFATFFWPLSRGALVMLWASSALSYRVALVSMTLYVIIGLLLFLYWKRQPSK